MIALPCGCRPGISRCALSDALWRVVVMIYKRMLRRRATYAEYAQARERWMEHYHPQKG